MNGEYIIDVRYYTWLNIWSFIEYNILWSTSQWVFCCFARGSVGASLLNSNLRLACESLQNIWNAKMLELSFPFYRFADRNIEIFQSPSRYFQDLEWSAHSRYNRHKCIDFTTSVLACRRHKCVYMRLMICRRLQRLSIGWPPNLILSLLIGTIGTTQLAVTSRNTRLHGVTQWTWLPLALLAIATCIRILGVGS
jgi:hypothetical protein